MKDRKASFETGQAERGAVAMIVAMLLAGGVVMGMLALTVDVGNTWWERRQLQNAADATSIALARECAKSVSNCAPARVADLLGQNSGARDRTAGYLRTPAMPDGACQRNVPASGLPQCPSATSDARFSELAKCPPLADALKSGAGRNTQYVETYSRTDSNKSDRTILPSYFSQFILGGQGGPVRVAACARAAWGPIGTSRPSLPLVIGLCNWNEATRNGTQLMQSPPYTPGPSTASPQTVPSLKRQSDGMTVAPQNFITQIIGKVNGSETNVLASKFPCGKDLSAQSGQLAPGGFGWVTPCASLKPRPSSCADAVDACQAVVTASGTLPSDPGASLPTDCKSLIASYVGTEVDVPVVTSVSGSGGNASYVVNGVSSFFLAGYSGLNSATRPELQAYADNVAAYKDKTCIDTTNAGGQHWKSECLWGWFTSPVRPAGTIDPDVTPRGPITVQPAG